MGPSQPEGSRDILIVTSCFSIWDKLQPDGAPGSYADLTLLYLSYIDCNTETLNYMLAKMLQLVTNLNMTYDSFFSFCFSV